MDYELARRNMVDSQIRTNKVTNAELLKALEVVPRERFVPPEWAHAAYVDENLPLAPGRYLMEPMVFARLVQLADPQVTDRVLVVGSGSGYGAAVLANLVRSVVALESDSGLAARGREQFARLRIDGATQVDGPLTEGWILKAPYEIILVEGAVEVLPGTLFEQLADGGRLVAVVETDGIGRATLFDKRNDVLSHRTVFDASVPVLPGLKRKRGFVF
ncbi:MAG TPA: protein-L-isoaspartate O-methyltransferase [Candidatus Udaeobacter sp.]|nr:protein-L-isoaspartate O-methyltransferase [Candidatus Udaeobacter sp.]